MKLSYRRLKARVTLRFTARFSTVTYHEYDFLNKLICYKILFEKIKEHAFTGTANAAFN